MNRLITFSAFAVGLLGWSQIAAPSIQYGPREVPVTLGQELSAIAQIESNGGRNKAHHRLERGVCAGETAGGSYGLLPCTVRTLMAHSQRLTHELGWASSITDDEITSILNTDTETDQMIAAYYWRLLRSRFNREQAAFAWLHGEGAIAYAPSGWIENDSYVRQFENRIYEQN